MQRKTIACQRTRLMQLLVGVSPPKPSSYNCLTYLLAGAAKVLLAPAATTHAAAAAAAAVEKLLLLFLSIVRPSVLAQLRVVESLTAAGLELIRCMCCAERTSLLDNGIPDRSRRHPPAT